MDFRDLGDKTRFIVTVLVGAIIITGSAYFINLNAKVGPTNSKNITTTTKITPQKSNTPNDNTNRNTSKKTDTIEATDSLITFPRDSGAHNDAIEEWWYFNGHVKDQNNKRYGIIICFFKNGNLYYGITDESNGKFYGGVTKGILIASNEKMDLSIGKNSWAETKQGTFILHVGDGDSYLDLQMTSEKPPLYIGGLGLIPMGHAGTSYYYSLTKLEVKGRLKIDDETTIHGIGWIDKQWGDWNNEGYRSWDWFSIQLENNEELNVFKIYDLNTGEPINPQINIMHKDNKTEVITSFAVTALEQWTDPATGRKFPQKWKLTIPEKNIELIITSTLDNQLIIPTLWEGSCTVTGWYGNEQVSGYAYTELLRK